MFTITMAIIGPIAGFGLGVIAGATWAIRRAEAYWTNQFRTLHIRREMHDAGREHLPREGAVPVTLPTTRFQRAGGAVKRIRTRS